MGTNLRAFLPYAVIIVMAVLLFHQCERSAIETKHANDSVNVLLDSVSYYKNKIGTVTAGRQTLELTALQLKKLLVERDERLQTLTAKFTKVSNAVKYTSNTNIPPLAIAFKETRDSLPNTHAFERKGFSSTEWYDLGYRVTADSLYINPLSIPTETYVLTGVKRKWLFGKPILTTEVTNTNPYITVTGLTSAEVVVPDPLYKKWYLWLAVGVATGVIVSAN